MKNIILIITIMVAACATTPTKPVKELALRESVVGIYKYKNKYGKTRRLFFLNRDDSAAYGTPLYGETFPGDISFPLQGGRVEGWTIVNDGPFNAIHIIMDSGIEYHWGINPDKSITLLTEIDKEGNRKNIPKEKQSTYEKIN